MGQVLHGSATTTEAIRRAIQHSQASLRALSKRYGINQKTVAKWRQRTSVADQRTGPREPRSTVLSPKDDAIVVAFRCHRPLPLDDCVYALRATIPHGRSAGPKGLDSRIVAPDRPFCTASRTVTVYSLLRGPGRRCCSPGPHRPKLATAPSRYG